MRRLRWPLAFLIILVLASCASTPTNRWAQTRVTLTSTQDTLLAGHMAGSVSDETLDRANPLVLSIRAYLNVAESYLPEGGTSFEYQMQMADQVLDELILLLTPEPD